MHGALRGAGRSPDEQGDEKIVLIALLLLGTSSAVSAWSDLKEGFDPKAAKGCVGAQLFENRTRGGTVVNWVYDNGGYILFENGRVRYWQAPHEKKSWSESESRV